MARLYKRGRIWWTWFYDVDGKRHDATTRCRDKRAAELVARRHERLGAADRDRAENETTLDAACEQFRVDRRNRGCTPDTLSYYATKLRHLLRLLGRATELGDVDATGVDVYITKRLDEGASRHSVAKELGALGGVLRLAVRRGQYERDPSTVLPRGWSTGYVPRKLSLTDAEARLLVDELRADRAAHVAFLLTSGASLGPSLSARRRDFDVANGTIRIRGTKTPERARVVPIFDHVADLAARAYAGANTGGASYARWTNVRRDIAAACARAGVPRCSPNDLRRTAATWLIERGAPSHLVAYFLGHSSSRMVEQVYGRVDGPGLKKAFASVGIAAAPLQRGPVAKVR